MRSSYSQVFIRLRSHTTGEWLAPPELRDRLVADARDAGSNITDVVIRLLGDQLRVACEPSTRKTAPIDGSEVLNLRLPMKLYRALAKSASRHPRSVQREIVARLCLHYGLV